MQRNTSIKKMINQILVIGRTGQIAKCLQDHEKSNRLLSKPASGSQVLGTYGTENRSVLDVREDLSTEVTTQLASEVEFRKKSNLIFIGRPDFDVKSKEDLVKIVDVIMPDIIINCSAYTNVEEAELDQESAYDLNVNAAINLSEICQKFGITLIHFSTDYIFDGKKTSPYHVNDETNPLSVYGQTKLQAEHEIMRRMSNYIILRTSLVYSPYGKNFVKSMISLAKNNREISIVTDQTSNPTCAFNLADVTMKIVDNISSDQNDTKSNVKYGIYHYTDDESLSPLEFTKQIFEILEKRYMINSPAIKAIKLEEYKSKATRPLFSVLDCGLTEQIFGIKKYSGQESLLNCIDKIFNPT